MTRLRTVAPGLSSSAFSHTIDLMPPKNRSIFHAAAGALALMVMAGHGWGQPPELPPPPAPMPPVLQNYQPVTAERLKNPEDGNWLMIRRTYDGWGYSPLDQITPANVASCSRSGCSPPARPRSTKPRRSINNGVMFVSTPNNQVIAIDAKTGNLLWRYRSRSRRTRSVPHDTSRGVALYGDKVYFAAGEAVLVALDAKTGKEVWTTHGRRQQVRLLHLARAADRRRQSHGRRFGRRIWNPRLRRCLRSRNRQGAVANLYHSRARRARQRDLAERRPMENRRRLRSGSPAITIPRPTWRIGASATAARGWATSVPATISTPRPPSRSTSPPARSKAITNTIRTIRGIGTKFRRRSWWTYQRNGRTIKGLIDVARDGYLWFLEAASTDRSISSKASPS